MNYSDNLEMRIEKNFFLESLRSRKLNDIHSLTSWIQASRVLLMLSDLEFVFTFGSACTGHVNSTTYCTEHISNERTLHFYECAVCAVSSLNCRFGEISASKIHPKAFTFISQRNGVSFEDFLKELKKCNLRGIKINS